MLVAEVDITLDLPFGTVDYALLDEVIHRALLEAKIPVTDVEVGNLRPIDAPVDPTQMQVAPSSPFAPRVPLPLGGPGPFGG